MTSQLGTTTGVKTKFTVVLIPDPDDGGYVVMVPRLPGCVTEGDTIEEALERAEEAIQLFVEDVVADGDRIADEDPQPLVRLIEVEVPDAGR